MNVVTCGVMVRRATPDIAPLNLEHLLHLVAEVVDDLDADAAMFRPGERAGNGEIQLRPRRLVALTTEPLLKRPTSDRI
jgi:hypothetical protein